MTCTVRFAGFFGALAVATIVGCGPSTPAAPIIPTGPMSAEQRAAMEAHDAKVREEETAYQAQQEAEAKARQQAER